jgi:5-methylcytosine-specific restriction endonuclease McrA
LFGVYLLLSWSDSLAFSWSLSKDKICGICSKKVDSWDDYHLDHKIAHNNGGKTELLNSQITHKKCNQEKSKK